MDPIEFLRLKKVHIARLANSHGTEGEKHLVGREHWISKPKGLQMKCLLSVLEEAGTKIKASSFDAIALPAGAAMDFRDVATLRRLLPTLTFVEIKTASQPRVREDFSGFFFALTEGEIDAATKLGPRHRVALFNRLTNTMLLTSVAELLARARSTTMQLSIQL